MIDDHELILRGEKPACNQETDTVEIEAQEDDGSLCDRWRKWAETVDR